MTERMMIEFNVADKEALLDVFERFKVRFLPNPKRKVKSNKDDKKLSVEQQEWLNGVKESFLWAKKCDEGEIPENEIQTLDDLLKEIASENNSRSAV